MKAFKLKYFIFFLLFICLGFGMGFLLGAYPERWSKALGKSTHSLTLIFSDEKLVPLQSLLAFEKSAGIELQIKVIPSYFLFQAEASKADLVFIPFHWYENSIPLLMDSSSMTDFNQLLFSDFASMRLASTQFLPLFWKVEKNKDGSELLLWGFAMTKNNPDSSYLSAELISYFLNNPERIKRWILQVGPTEGLASTTKVSESLADLPVEFKAGRLRDYPLSKLSIKHLLD